MRAAFEAMGAEPPGLRLACTNVVPHARGLGSSSAAIVAGLSLARGLVAGGRLLLDDQAVFQLAAEIEGHPDNVAPAFFGGFVISGHDDAGFYAVSSAVDPRISVVVFVPPDPLSTELARGLLPAEVPHADAAADAGRTALLVAALGGKPEHLLRATRDYLHQEYRRPAMPASLDLVDALRADGVPAIVSGAGPTVLAFTESGRPAQALAERSPETWQAHHLEVDTDGARVV
jgi:homoserine kinase